jgi:hypothetical protein
MERRWLTVFAWVFGLLVVLPLLRLFVLWPSRITPPEALLFYIYFMIASIPFGGGSWRASSIHLAAPVIYTVLSIVITNGIISYQQRKKRT